MPQQLKRRNDGSVAEDSPGKKKKKKRQPRKKKTATSIMKRRRLGGRKQKPFITNEKTDKASHCWSANDNQLAIACDLGRVGV